MLELAHTIVVPSSNLAAFSLGNVISDSEIVLRLVDKIIEVESSRLDQGQDCVDDLS
jgi:hypothetical protein